MKSSVMEKVKNANEGAKGMGIGFGIGLSYCSSKREA
jgi:hypothetical protein